MRTTLFLSLQCKNNKIQLQIVGQGLAVLTVGADCLDIFFLPPLGDGSL